MSKREFNTGALRDTDKDKLDFEGFLNPRVLVEYAKYLNKHRLMKDGTYRDSDNWQKGIPKDVYMKSMLRHQIDVWLEHRGYKSRDGMVDALCGVIFNAMGYLLELLKEQDKQIEMLKREVCLGEGEEE
jgi:hypothetical protein